MAAMAGQVCPALIGVTREIVAMSTPRPRTPPHRLLTRRDVALRLKVSLRHLSRMVSESAFPPPVTLGRRCLRWREADIAAYVAGLTSARVDTSAFADKLRRICPCRRMTPEELKTGCLRMCRLRNSPIAG